MSTLQRSLHRDIEVLYFPALCKAHLRRRLRCFLSRYKSPVLSDSLTIHPQNACQNLRLSVAATRHCGRSDSHRYHVQLCSRPWRMRIHKHKRTERSFCVRDGFQRLSWRRCQSQQQPYLQTQAIHHRQRGECLSLDR